MTVPGSVIVGYVDGGNWSACFGLSYRDMLLRDLCGPQRIVRPGGRDLRVEAGTMGVAAGRNDICRQMLDTTDGEWLLMIDTDMGFPADLADQLVTAAERQDLPVLGALCFSLKREPVGEHYANRYRIQPTLYRYVERADEVGFTPMLAYPRDEVVQVSATGAACLLIHRDVLAAIRAEQGDVWFDPMTHPTGNPGGRPRAFSEDLSFCVRVAAAGLPVHVHTGVRTTHDKGGVFLDEHMYLRQVRGGGGPVAQPDSEPVLSASAAVAARPAGAPA